MQFGGPFRPKDEERRLVPWNWTFSVNFTTRRDLSTEADGIIRVVSKAERPLLSLCVMVVDWASYEECRATFLAGGFDPSVCE